MSTSTWTFVKHYGEMVAAMLVGMAGLGLVSLAGVGLPDRVGLRLVEMAAWMTVPMVAWMRFRGHAWRPCAEMAASMVVPAVAVLALLGTGALTDEGALMMIEHTAMFPAMLAVMLLRRDEYSGQHHHAPA
jgi:flagellar biosynthetic protein FliP